jgi:hypothetical protein
MSKGVSRRARVWTVFVLAAIGCGGLAGCAGTGERLPQCKGRPQPINTVPVHAAPITASVPAADASHDRSDIDAH